MVRRVQGSINISSAWFGVNVMEMLLEPSRAQMNGARAGEREGERTDLRLAKDKDTCARKKRGGPIVHTGRGS